ncbi:hypothetical protein [Spirosoma pollinicola]|nr:hypothetical protein [Spirosoma pollinicola]
MPPLAVVLISLIGKMGYMPLYGGFALNANGYVTELTPSFSVSYFLT